MAESSENSARALRQRFRDMEGESSRLRLLEDAALQVAEESSVRAALAAILARAQRFLAADSGLVLMQEGGALTVQAATGAVLPIGARIPMGGALGAVLKPPMQPSLRENIESRLRVGRQPEVALELLLPLRFCGKALGIMALMSETSPILPTESDLRTLAALGTVMASTISGGSGIPKARASRRDVTETVARLTPREQQIFALLPKGVSNAEIAAQLGIASGTVKVHMEHILHKLGLKDRTQAALRAAEWGFRT